MKNNNLDNNLKSIYKLTKRMNFDQFLDTIIELSFGNIDSSIQVNSNFKSIYFDLIKKMPVNKPKFQYWEINNKISIRINFDDKPFNYKKITLDFPILLDDVDYVFTTMFQFLIDNKINSITSIHKNNSFNNLQIIVDDVASANMIINNFATNPLFNGLGYYKVPDYLINSNNIIIYSEIKPFNFYTFLYQFIFEYFSTITNINDISTIGLYIYINNKYVKETNVNKKRMLRLISNYVAIRYNNYDYVTLFDYNTNIDVSVLNANDYFISKSSNNNIIFVNKNDSSKIIHYGSESYLDLIYSYFLSNFVNDSNKEYLYNKLYFTYDDVLSSNFKNIYKVCDLIKDEIDMNYKKIFIMSSSYFAYKKLNLTLKQTYQLIDMLIKKISLS